MVTFSYNLSQRAAIVLCLLPGSIFLPLSDGHNVLFAILFLVPRFALTETDRTTSVRVERQHINV